jgi:hypothetical protein
MASATARICATVSRVSLTDHYCPTIDSTSSAQVQGSAA